jgi:uncharacterized repeat protein (TIGR01451 family)
MRRRMWLLAMAGILVGITGIVIAQNRRFLSDDTSASSLDSTQNSTTSNRRIQSFYSRSGKTGSQTGTVTGTVTDGTAGDAINSGQREPVGSFPSRYTRERNSQGTTQVPDIRNYHDELFGAKRPQPTLRPTAATPPAGNVPPLQFEAGTSSRFQGTNRVIQAGGVTDPRGTSDRVINAEYSRKNGSSTNGQILPVSVTDNNVSPFDRTENIAPSKAKAAAIPIPVTSAAVGAQTHSVTLEWVKQSDINVGQECECDLVVRNTGKLAVHQVHIEAFFPSAVRLTSATPKPTSSQDRLVWVFDSLDAGKAHTIRIKMIPSRRGQLATTANVRFTGAAAGLFEVQEPLLKVAMKGPKEVMVGDPASQVITVTNPGTGVATGVKIEALIPEGLEHPRGERLVMEVGSLNPGESRQIRIALAAANGGRHAVHVTATADSDLKQVIEGTVLVVAPSLKIAVDGPGLRYLGRKADYTVAVLNDGQIASSNVRVSQQIPVGFKFVGADKGGKYDRDNHTVTWFVGGMAAGQTIKLRTQLAPEKIGSFDQIAWVTSEHGNRETAKAVTRVEGTASLVLEIVDLDDPVEIGTETAYEIRIRNEGTKAAGNVSLSCELPNGVKLVSAKGPASHIAENGLVVFKSLGTLAPGKTAVYRVHVRGTAAGNHRFRARLASDSNQEPLIFEELTKFYVD